MALVGRSPIKVTAAPSTAPQEAMAASLQAHIDELVQKNRTCEHTIKRLQQALADEKERSLEAATRLKAELQQEREEWREGCDSLLASHRIIHVRTLIELDKERVNCLLEKEESRRDRINILHRDYKLTLFQAKETELEAKAGALEDALEELTEVHEQDAREYMERVRALERDLQKAERVRADVVSRLKADEVEFASLQSELSVLRKENATLKASSESTSTKLERVTLQLEGAKTSAAELENTNADLKRTNADLKRQMDRWQSLETKGDAEVEEMRKQRIELEVHVKELQGRVKDLEQVEKDITKAMDKERKKVEKLKKENDRMAEVTEEAQSIAKKAQDEYEEATEQLRAARRLVEELQSGKLTKSQLRKGKMPAKGADRPIANAEPESLDPSEREVEVVLTPESKSRVRPRPAHGRNRAEAQDAAEEDASAPGKKSRTRVASSSKKKVSAEVDTEAEQDDDEIPRGKRSGKQRARTKDEGSNAIPKRKSKDVESDHEEKTEEIPDEKELPKTSKDKGKGRAVEPASDSENEPRIKTKGRTKKSDKEETSDVESAPKKPGVRQKKAEREDGAGDQSSTRPKSRKPSSSQGPRVKVVDNADEEETRPKKKKKRLFPPSQTETFPWDVLPKGEGFAGLNIPTQLSPVKDTDAVPARVFGRVGSALGFR